MKMTEQEILYDKIVEYQEEIANLRAEILELKVEDDDESEPYQYAQQIIENYDLDQIEEKTNGYKRFQNTWKCILAITEQKMLKRIKF